MRKGERRKVHTRCAVCRFKVIVSRADGTPYSAAEVAAMQARYVCGSCEDAGRG